MAAVLAPSDAFLHYPVLTDQLGIHDPSAPVVGTRAMAVTRSYVAAFFDRYLRSAGGALLDGPSSAFPDVTFHQQGRNGSRAN